MKSISIKPLKEKSSGEKNVDVKFFHLQFLRLVKCKLHARICNKKNRHVTQVWERNCDQLNQKIAVKSAVKKYMTVSLASRGYRYMYI